MYAVLLSTVLVFVAELGDKSQLLSMTFATRYRARAVILGAGLATAAIDLDSGGEPSRAANRSAWASENPARMPAAIDDTASVNCSSSNARSRVARRERRIRGRAAAAARPSTTPVGPATK